MEGGGFVAQHTVENPEAGKRGPYKKAAAA
jgi:hypothetical protein